jgi:hypothetical protein
MEVAKASNLLEHEAEIMSRPRRDWFLSSRQKAEIAKAAKPVAASELSEQESAAARKSARAAKGMRNADAKGVNALPTQRHKPIPTIRAMHGGPRRLPLRCGSGVEQLCGAVVCWSCIFKLYIGPVGPIHLICRIWFLDAVSSIDQRRPCKWRPPVSRRPGGHACLVTCMWCPLWPRSPFVVRAGSKAQHKADKQAPGSHTAATRAEMGTVKAAKAAARHMREGGQRPKESSAAALAAVGVKQREKQKRPKVASGGLDDNVEGGAARKMARGSTHVYTGDDLLAYHVPCCGQRGCARARALGSLVCDGQSFHRT